MNDPREDFIRRHAREFPYPQMPQRSTRRHRRWYLRPAWVVVVTLLASMVLFREPIQATVLHVIQLGTVILEFTSGDEPQDVKPLVLKDIAGETTLSEAVAQVPYPIRLPEGYEPPDYVYLQDSDAQGQMAITVWLADDGEMLFALYHIPEGWWVPKQYVDIVETTNVNGKYAIWVLDPHTIMLMRDGQSVEEQTTLVSGPVLIWTQDPITYRLEGNMDGEALLAIAESLR